LEISAGLAYAKVRGSRPQPYDTFVSLRPFSDDEWGMALDALAAQPIYVAKLLAGEMPSDIDGVFSELGLSLFPRPGDSRDLGFECSCPDYAVPCKHAAAACCLLAEQLDTDPFLLLHLRGRARGKVLDALRPASGGLTASELPEARPGGDVGLDMGSFWVGARPIPAVPPPGAFAPMFRQFGEPPREVADAAALERVYENLVQATRRLGPTPTSDE
jgi:hypothetical protein